MESHRIESVGLVCATLPAIWQVPRQMTSYLTMVDGLLDSSHLIIIIIRFDVVGQLLVRRFAGWKMDHVLSPLQPIYLSISCLYFSLFRSCLRPSYIDTLGLS